jgi:PilZ domain
VKPILGSIPLTVEVQLESAQVGKRPARHLFVATVKATDADSGKQIPGLTMDLSEGGCLILTRRARFSQGARIRLEITRNGVSFLTNATVVYNLKDRFMGLRFEEMSPEQVAIVAGWMKAALRMAQEKVAKLAER